MIKKITTTSVLATLALVLLTCTPRGASATTPQREASAAARIHVSVSSAASAACHAEPFGEWSACDSATKTRTRSSRGPASDDAACPAIKETARCTPSVEDAAHRAGEIPSGGLALLVIDQQVDFHPGGSLAIAGADGDAARIAAFIDEHADEISQLVFTLDSHQPYHIAHGVFWTDGAGASPAPFTTITHADVARGAWTPRDTALTEYALAYTTALEARGKLVLTIWPEHCLVGSPGHDLEPTVHAAALAWSRKKRTAIQYVLKGTNPFTEHYSAFRAEVELAFDASTQLNRALVATLARARRVAIVGEALSHCVNHSVRDLVAHWPVARRRDLVLFTDCSSPVAGFEAVADEFVADMRAAGLTVMNSTAF